MPGLKRVANILKYGVGPAARERKQADKARRRKELFLDPERWEHGEAFARRRYDSYDDYVSHQAAKLDQIVHRLHETEDDDFTEFKRRFESCECFGVLRGGITDVKRPRRIRAVPADPASEVDDDAVAVADDTVAGFVMR